MNQVRLTGTLIERSAMRFTPAGVSVVEAQVRHQSEVVEAGLPRALDITVSTIALGPVAGELDRESLGVQLDLAGFLAPRSRRSNRLILHVTQFRRSG